MSDVAITFGDVEVFSGLSASFEPARVTALVGPSGSGKSSLLAAIAGHQPLAAGSIEHRARTALEQVSDATVIVATHDPVLVEAADATVSLRREAVDRA